MFLWVPDVEVYSSAVAIFRKVYLLPLRMKRVWFFIGKAACYRTENRIFIQSVVMLH